MGGTALQFIRGTIYAYEYKDGTEVRFLYDSTRRALGIRGFSESLYGTVISSSRPGLDAGTHIQRIISLTSIDPSRMWFHGNRRMGSPSIAATPETRQVCTGTHVPVNVGFHSLHLVCRVCDTELSSDAMQPVTRGVLGHA